MFTLKIHLCYTHYCQADKQDHLSVQSKLGENSPCSRRTSLICWKNFRAWLICITRHQQKTYKNDLVFTATGAWLSHSLSLRLPVSIHTYCTLFFFLINTRFTKKERERMIWSWGIQNISGKGIVFLLRNTHLWPRFNALALMLECTLIHDRCGSSRLLQDMCMHAKLLQSCPTVWDPMDCSPPGSVHGDSPGKYTGVSCHALLQGIFPT